MNYKGVALLIENQSFFICNGEIVSSEQCSNYKTKIQSSMLRDVN